MADTFVFAGPSVTGLDVAALLPGAVVLPPVAHGDLLRLDPAPGDRVLIIDGLFLHSAPVRHREILLLLQRGVCVAGASSMGALRAAELWRFGMRGIGRVFELYRDGVVTDDDEVAIAHATAEDGYRAYSEPLVNIRLALRDAVAAGVVRPPTAQALLATARDLPFRARGYRALARLFPLGEQFFAWVAEHRPDAKAADARELLTLAAAGDPGLRPPDGRDTPIRNVHTQLLDNWVIRHRTSTVDDDEVPDADAIAAVMLTHPDYVARHRAEVLAAVAGTDPADPATPDAARRVARGRGLAPVAGSWLTPDESTLDDDEALARLLVRAFGTRAHRRLTAAMLPRALDHAGVLDEARRFAAQAERLNRTLPRPDPARPDWRKHFRNDVVDRTFAALWDCPVEAVAAAAWDRGLADLDSFRLLAEPFVAHLKILGPPSFGPPHLGPPASGGTHA
jgi:hypothetical protein